MQFSLHLGLLNKRKHKFIYTILGTENIFQKFFKVFGFEQPSVERKVNFFSRLSIEASLVCIPQHRRVFYCRNLCCMPRFFDKGLRDFKDFFRV